VRLLAAVVVLLLVPACQAPPSEMTEVEKEAVVAEVEAWAAEFEEAWEALDLERALALDVQTPEHIWVGGGVITRGFDAFSENGRIYYSSIEAVDWIPSDRHFSVLSRDAAVISDVGKVVVTNSEGVTSESDYTYTYVLVRRDGEWKMLLGHGA